MYTMLLYISLWLPFKLVEHARSKLRNLHSSERPEHGQLLTALSKGTWNRTWNRTWEHHKLKRACVWLLFVWKFISNFVYVWKKKNSCMKKNKKEQYWTCRQLRVKVVMAFHKLKINWTLSSWMAKKGWFQGELLTSSPTQFEHLSGHCLTGWRLTMLCTHQHPYTGCAHRHFLHHRKQMHLWRSNLRQFSNTVWTLQWTLLNLSKQPVHSHLFDCSNGTSS